MAQEEHTQKCSKSISGGGGGGRGGGGGGSGSGSGSGCGGNNRSSSKKLKQKKVPQRGLGVAQLEKIRIEEQKKKDAALQAASILSPSNSSSCLAVQCPSFRPPPNLSPPPPPHPIPLPSPSPTDLPSPNSIFRPSPSVPNVEILLPHSNTVQALNVGSCGEMGWSGSLGHGMDFHQSFSFPSTANLLSYDSHSTSPVWPLSGLMQRSQQLLQPSSSTTVNVSSGTSSSSVINFQIEPPSNQSFCSNKYTSLWPEEDKIAGMKRPYPFYLDDPPGPLFHCKIARVAPPMARSDESPSCSDGGKGNIECGHHLTLREGPSCSGGHLDLNSKNFSNGNGGLNGDFLSLAPPATALPELGLKDKHHSAYFSTFSRESSEMVSPCYQGNGEDHQNHWFEAGESTQQPLFSFFPSAKAQNGHAAAASLGKCHGEVGEDVDLNLRL